MKPQETTRRQYLEAMGIPVWVSREPDEPKAEAVYEPTCAPTAPVIAEASVSDSDIDVGALDWSALQATVQACTRCELHKTRNQTVFGTGNQNAQWLFVGEAPGADEDRQGEPFVGKAGQLLNDMLFALGLKREDIYIANVLKCRPPNNRDPQPHEVEQCEPYLARQIELIQPRIIVTLGRHAVHNLLKTDQALGRLRGQKLEYRGTPLLATYHPAYLLRNPIDKRKVWEDLCMARNIVEQS